jgi:hypothetical protein
MMTLRRESIVLFLATLSFAVGPCIGRESPDGRLLMGECRKEAAVRFINDFVQVGAQQKVEGTEIVIKSFRNDRPEQFETYFLECAKRKSGER